jgi:SAM-dependent methyltransferase
LRSTHCKTPDQKHFDREYFQNNYGNYNLQSPPKKSRLYLDMIRSSMAAGRLLDIGCSFGLFLREAATSFHCFGMDVSPQVVATAAKNLPQAGFVAGRLPEIPFSNLDVITALDVLEHTEDPAAALAAIRGALRPGGIALVVVPVYDGPLGFITGLLDRDPTHIQKKSRHYWLELTKNQFEIITWQGFLRKLLCNRWYINLPMLKLRAIAPAIAILLQRPEKDKP